jgi:hypothetical protein
MKRKQYKYNKVMCERCYRLVTDKYLFNGICSICLSEDGINENF